MFRLTCDTYTLLVSDHPPLIYDSYREHATFVEHLESDDTWREQDDFLFVAVQCDQQQRPSFVVTQRYGPGPGAAFFPGILLIPETSLLFIGAGTRLLAYQLKPPALLWEDSTDPGFWGWERYKDVIIMSAELELGVWDITGKKLWATFVEPPWHYTLNEDTIDVDVMGMTASFPLHEGPPTSFRWR